MRTYEQFKNSSLTKQARHIAFAYLIRSFLTKNKQNKELPKNRLLTNQVIFQSKL